MHKCPAAKLAAGRCSCWKVRWGAGEVGPGHPHIFTLSFPLFFKPWEMQGKARCASPTSFHQEQGACSTNTVGDKSSWCTRGKNSNYIQGWADTKLAQLHAAGLQGSKVKPMDSENPIFRVWNLYIRAFFFFPLPGVSLNLCKRCQN